MEHSFDIQLAKKYGMVEAVLLKHLWFWVEKNRANGTNFIDGRFWTFNSNRAFLELFPYLTASKIRRSLSKLADEGIIIIDNHNKVAYDRTSWYAFTDFGESIMNVKTETSNLQNANIHLSKRKMEVNKTENGSEQNSEPIPDNNTDINTDNKPDICVKDTEKHQHGTFKNVNLTDSEYQKLIDMFGERCESRIEAFSESKKMKKYNYTSDYLAIIKWYLLDCYRICEKKGFNREDIKERRNAYNRTVPKPEQVTEVEFVELFIKKKGWTLPQ